MGYGWVPQYVALKLVENKISMPYVVNGEESNVSMCKGLVKTQDVAEGESGIC